jgi:hypothetical protein
VGLRTGLLLAVKKRKGLLSVGNRIKTVQPVISCYAKLSRLLIIIMIICMKTWKELLDGLGKGDVKLIMELRI